MRPLISAALVSSLAAIGCAAPPASDDFAALEAAIGEGAQYVAVEAIDGAPRRIDALALRKPSGEVFYAVALAPGSRPEHAAALGPPDAYPGFPSRDSARVPADPEPTFTTLPASQGALVVRMGARIERGDQLAVLELSPCDVASAPLGAWVADASAFHEAGVLPGTADGFDVTGAPMLVFDESGSIDATSFTHFDESGRAGLATGVFGPPWSTRAVVRTWRACPVAP